MKIRDVMTREVATTTLETPFKTLVGTMLDRNITGLPVVDERGRLLGIVTEADLMDKQAYGESPGTLLGMLRQTVFGPPVAIAQKAWAMTAGGLMSVNLHTAGPDDDVRRVARRLLERGIKRMPVVDGDGLVVGIVSRRDLLAAYARSDDDLAADVRRTLADPRSVPEDAEIEQLAVRDGVVRLEGIVNHPTDIAVITGALRRIPGVVQVETQFSAREPEPSVS